MPKIASGIRVSKVGAGRVRTVTRSAKTGRFVSKAAVARWPGKTTTERVGSGTGNARAVNRSASSGRFVTDAQAKRNPGGTITQREVLNSSSGVQAAPVALRERADSGAGVRAPSLPGGLPAEPSVDRARRLRHLRDIARLDYLRELRRLGGSLTQLELARSLGVSQPAVSDSLKTAARLPEPRAGFSGADPYEIAQRYAAGELTRAQVVDELARWEYRPWTPTDGYDWTTGDEGEWEQTVAVALREGLLDPETYDAILDRRDELGQ